MAFARPTLPDWRRAVVKVGSALVAPDGAPSDRHLGAVSQFVGESRRRGREVVVVSSGAVAAGLGAGERRPHAIPEKQALAALGQPRLMALWAGLLDAPVAQVLLTHDDLVHRDRFLNAQRTFTELLRRGAVPVVNENDTVAVDELRVGDNDNLAAHVASLVGAGLLVILTDVAGLHDADPRVEPDARLVPIVERVDAGVRALAGGAGTAAGTGGMWTKVEAAEKATARGIATALLDGSAPGPLAALAEGRVEGTLFRPLDPPLSARRHWLLHATPVTGRLTVDAGAARALRQRGASLLPSGVVAVSGDVRPGDPVEIADERGRVLGRGVVRYGAAELERVRGRHSAEIEAVLGHAGSATVVHRDDLVLTDPDDSDA